MKLPTALAILTFSAIVASRAIQGPVQPTTATSLFPTLQLRDLQLNASAISAPTNISHLRLPFDTAGDWDGDDELTDEQKEAIWCKAKSRGYQLMQAMRLDDEEAATTLDWPYTQSPWDGDLRDELEKWGYKDDFEDDEEIDKQCDFDKTHEMADAFKDLGVDPRSKGQGGSNQCFYVEHMNGPTVFRGIDGETPFPEDQNYRADDKILKVTQAYLKIGINAADGLVYFIHRQSPEDAALENWGYEPDKDELPKLRSSSDISWGMWNRVAAGSQNLRYFMSLSVVNPISSYIMQRTLEDNIDIVNFPGWPGKDFEFFTKDSPTGLGKVIDVEKSENALALLGAPNGIAAGYFLIQHRQQLGRKQIVKVRIWSTGEGIWANPNILFYVRDRGPFDDLAMQAGLEEQLDALHGQQKRGAEAKRGEEVVNVIKDVKMRLTLLATSALLSLLATCRVLPPTSPSHALLNTTSLASFNDNHLYRISAAGKPRPVPPTPWQKYVCRGQKLHQACISGKDKAVEFVTPVDSKFDSTLESELAQWGYYDRPEEAATYCWFELYLPTELKELDINPKGKDEGGPNECFMFKHYNDLSSDVPADKQQPRATSALAVIGANAPDGVIYFINVKSAYEGARELWGVDNPTPDDLPQLRQISDMAWGAWRRKHSPGQPLGGIKKFFVDHIVNRVTIELVAEALKTYELEEGEIRPESVPNWPGLTFDMNTEQGLAMLGSPNGIAIGYFLAQHKTQLGGNKYVSKVQVFTNPEDDDSPYLLFWIADDPMPSSGDAQNEQGKVMRGLRGAKRGHNARHVTRKHVIKAKLTFIASSSQYHCPTMKHSAATVFALLLAPAACRVAPAVPRQYLATNITTLIKVLGTPHVAPHNLAFGRDALASAERVQLDLSGSEYSDRSANPVKLGLEDRRVSGEGVVSGSRLGWGGADRSVLLRDNAFADVSVAERGSGRCVESESAVFRPDGEACGHEPVLCVGDAGPHLPDTQNQTSPHQSQDQERPSQSHSLTARDLVTAANANLWQAWVCRGEKLNQACKNTKDKAAGFAAPIDSPWDGTMEEDLKLWGYREVPADTHCDFSDIEKALKGLGIGVLPAMEGGDNHCFQVRHSYDDGSEVKDQTYDVKGRKLRMTDAYSIIGANAISGAVFFVDIKSAQRGAEELWYPEVPTAASLPELRAISDIAWAFWNRVQAKRPPKRRNLGNSNYFVVHNIVNKDTEKLIEQALKKYDVPDGQQRLAEVPVWPGLTFDIESETGQAMLGSPNGLAAGYFLAQHKTQIGSNRFVHQIQVLASDWGGGPSMVLHVKEAPSTSDNLEAIEKRDVDLRLARRNVIFGANSTSPSTDISTLAGGDDEFWRKYVCRGEKLTQASIRNKDTAVDFMTPVDSEFDGTMEAELKLWGYTDHKGSSLYCELDNIAASLNSIGVDAKFRKGKRGGQNECFHIEYGAQADSVPIRDQNYEVDGTTYRMTGAWSHMGVNARDGVVTFLNVRSAQRGAIYSWAVEKPKNTELPQLRQISDIAWAFWRRAHGDGQGLGNINKFLVHDIVNAETLRLIGLALKRYEVPDGQQRYKFLPKWPGLELDIETPEGKAMLGSPNGVAAGYFRNKYVHKVTVWKDSDGDEQMLFWVKDAPPPEGEPGMSGGSTSADDSIADAFGRAGKVVERSDDGRNIIREHRLLARL
ncbi:hypothetical protein OPT61_g9226 [Boeremia exigua]|uniref:Uncharacterized protein n=1 Tax=Boeremia exigua TaxID=749465 RepID=A0ACC2HVR9_9PLEO|nr:hypothetical protein OPT61_g9226 [Boeremia exigua]